MYICTRNLYMYMYVYVYIYIYTCTCIYIYTYVHVYIYTYDPGLHFMLAGRCPNQLLTVGLKGAVAAAACSF